MIRLFSAFNKWDGGDFIGCNQYWNLKTHESVKVQEGSGWRIDTIGNIHFFSRSLKQM